MPTNDINEARTTRAPLPPSPCVGICALKGDHCYGCGRTSDEIAAWGMLGPDAQSAIWAELPGRLAAFGFKTFRLAAGPAIVAQFISRSFRETTGRWRVVSASVEVGITINNTGRPNVVETDQTIDATMPDGAHLHLIKHPKVRVFGFAGDVESPALDTVALVLPKGRADRDLKSASIPHDFPASARSFELDEEIARLTVATPNQDGSTTPVLTAAAALADMTATAPHTRALLQNGLGHIEAAVSQFAIHAVEPGSDHATNAPSDIKVSRAFVASAIFRADDPVWLAQALAPNALAT